MDMTTSHDEHCRSLSGHQCDCKTRSLLTLERPLVHIDRRRRLVGCPVCGGKLTKIRGKYPGDPKREVCPTCLQERMDMIRDISNNHYGVAATSND